MANRHQALLVLSFGGPEQPEDVIPFLENVLRGRNVPRERILSVAEHYYHFGGRSPINDQNRELIAALERELQTRGVSLPIYWGNRNWHPFLAETLRRMQADRIERSLVYVTSAFSSYSGCRQYMEDIVRAREEVGPGAPAIDKLPGFHDHPSFIECIAARVEDALAQLPGDRRDAVKLLFTAHSVPVVMATSSPYVRQLNESCALVAKRLGGRPWNLVYQSRSGPPSQPWLEPDILQALQGVRDESGSGADVIVSPIGFVSDHMEVLYDLDTEARAFAGKLGLNMVRAGTPGVHPLFVSMIAEMIETQLAAAEPYVCREDCCPAPRRPGA